MAWYDPPLAHRLNDVDWTHAASSLRERPFACLPALLNPAECGALAALYDEDHPFRSRVVMERHRFGVGEYRYFADPLPALVAELRERLYPPLAAIAKAWMDALHSDERFPASLEEFRRVCAARASVSPRRSSCATKRADTTACTRTSTAPSRSRSRSSRS